MLTNLRVKLRSRRSNIASCGYEDFLPLTKQFFAFLDTSPILTAIIAELLARNQESVAEVQKMLPSRQQNGRVYGTTAEAGATIGYVVWQMFSNQDRHDGFHSFALGSGNFDQASSIYKDWYVEPLFNYLDETLDDANIVLALLIRYKQKVEWYRRAEVMELYQRDTGRGERNVKQHMFEFLFDQGLPFHVEPAAASGEPDVVSLHDAENHFIGEVKIFDPDGSRGASYVKKAFYQAYRYCLDYNEPLAYLIVFNVSKKQLRVELPSDPDGVPRFEYNHKTIFLVVINIHEQEGTASKLGIADTVTISASELIHEVEESVEAKV
jgi:hypothetical protein